MELKLPSSSPRCALLSKATKLSQKPYCSTFGVFPDETLTTSFDRLLYFLGVSSRQKNVPSKSEESVICECEAVIKSAVCQTEANTCDKSTAISGSCEIKNVCTKCKKSRTWSPCPVTIITNRGKNVSILKRSFSLCSLACRKVREKLNRCPKAAATRWLWTKHDIQKNGIQVYEVYTNSTVNSHPTHIDNRSASRIIFLILPSGCTIPFETLACH